MASLAEKNLMPKLSTTMVNVVAMVEWVHRPGLFSTGAYLWGCRFLTSIF